MKKIKVLSNSNTVSKWEFNIDTIYHRTNCTKVITEDGREMWEYDEEQYNLMEITEYLNNRDIENKKALTEQNDAIIDNAYRVALLEFNSTI